MTPGMQRRTWIVAIFMAAKSMLYLHRKGGKRQTRCVFGMDLSHRVTVLAHRVAATLALRLVGMIGMTDGGMIRPAAAFGPAPATGGILLRPGGMMVIVAQTAADALVSGFFGESNPSLRQMPERHGGPSPLSCCFRICQTLAKV